MKAHFSNALWKRTLVMHHESANKVMHYGSALKQCTKETH